jgi:hypothetical protein
MGWIVLFGMFYSIVSLSQTFSLQSYESELLNQWLFSSKSVLWSNSIHLSMYLNTTGHSIINGTDVI